MANTANTIRWLPTGITSLFCLGYTVFFFIIFKRKYYLRFKNLLLEDKKRYQWIKKNMIQINEKFRAWWTNRFIPGIRQSLKAPWAKGTRLGYCLEISLIILWAVFVGRAYLNFDPSHWPFGFEFPSSIQTNFIWTNLFKCGACVFWNGFSHGGAPAFADMHGSMLYPLVILFTLILGVLNGAKLTLIAGLIMAGCAQWWLSKVMGFGRIPRLWSGLLAVVAGNLAAAMELGVFGVLLSTVACSLVLAPGVALGLTGKRRYSILLGVTIGLALLAGQGYMQVGLLVGILPALLVFLPGREPRFKYLWKEYLLAGCLAILIAGIFLIPTIHFYPNVTKAEDPLFKIAQPLKYIPLNHLIDDPAFYNTTALKPTPYPSLYATFLGWIPILLAILAWRFIPRSKFRLMLFFLVAILLVYLIASADLLKLFVKFLPLVAGVRNSPQIAGLADPLILGLSAWGLNAILQIKLPLLEFKIKDHSGSIPISKIALLILAIPLIWSLREAYVFGQNWLVTVKSDATLYQSVSYLKTASSEWVNLPFGEHMWLIPGFDMNLKISNGIRTWQWKNRQDPPINQEATPVAVDPSTPNLERVLNGLYFVSHPENEYAFIQNVDQKVVCKAQAVGGNIDVECPDSGKGRLIVYENNWTGWDAWVDQTRIPLLGSDWLSVDAPAGKHTYHFRYRPWDVWAGILLSILGIGLSTFLWFRAKKPN